MLTIKKYGISFDEEMEILSKIVDITNSIYHVLSEIDDAIFYTNQIQDYINVTYYLKKKHKDLLLINTNLEELICYDGGLPVIRKEIIEYRQKKYNKENNKNG